MVGLKITTDYSLPSSGVLSLTRLKEHLRISGSAEDDVLAGYLWAAVRFCEAVTGVSVLSATYTQTLDRFPGGASSPIRLLRSPATSLTSISYVDADGDSQTVTVGDYTLFGNAEPSIVVPDVGLDWPTDVATLPGSVSVVFVAGYASADVAPKHLIHAVYMLAGHWYENRETVVVGVTANNVPLAVDALLSLCKNVELDYGTQGVC